MSSSAELCIHQRTIIYRYLVSNEDLDDGIFSVIEVQYSISTSLL